MTRDRNKNQKTWRQLLLSTELRAMSGSLRAINDIINKDSTSTRQLADIILTDVALTTRVLTIANSVQHNPSAVTVSESALVQAIVRIGFGGLRAICISTAILDSVLKEMPNHPELLLCIVQSFENAVHSRNVANKAGGNAEEVFIAALLQNIGELVFWCSPIPKSKEYLDLRESAFDSPEKTLKKLSGMDFNDVSIALSRDWHLGDVLVESLEGEINPNTKAVHLGKGIKQAINEGWESASIRKLLQVQLSAMGLDILAAMKFMKDGDAEAKLLAASYENLVKEESVDSEIPVVASSEPEVIGDENEMRKASPPKATSLIRP
ncbi:MAG: HD-like signal output (HDOD) protein [Oceanicoccus sp.]|jgi:HD-like signal output (HDOD) protein